jgi:NADH-quinone oxidoreductase subunit J
VLLGIFVFSLPPQPAQAQPGAGQVNPADMGSIGNIGLALFTRYLLPFEAISILILIAILGAVVLAKRKVD